jgi:hypothetical protein
MMIKNDFDRDDGDDGNYDDNFSGKNREQPGIWITGVRITAGQLY